MSGDSVTKNDLYEVETRLDRRIDRVEGKLDIVARQVGSLTERVDTLTERVDTLTERVDTLTGRVDTIAGRVDTIAATMVTRDHLAAELAAFREEVNRDIARHMEAGFERMYQLFGVQDDRAKSIEDKHGALRRDFTEHARDTVLHNPS